MPATATIDAEHLTKLAAKIAKKIWRPGVSVDLDDLVSEGVIAGLKALPKFDPSRGVAIGTFLYQRVRGGILDTFRKPGAVLIRTPRSEPRVLVSGDHGETPLAELAVDRGGVDGSYTPAPPDTSGLSRQQRRLVRLLYRKRLSREETAAKLKVTLDRLEELEHETALVLRRSTQEVQPTTYGESEMIALAERHETQATETDAHACYLCHGPLYGNHRCRTRTCPNFNKGGRRPVGKGKSKGKKPADRDARVRTVVAAAPKDEAQPTVATPTVGPAELEALSAVTRAMLGLSDAARARVVAWVGRTFGGGS